jgi:hypothetical protein
LNPALAALLAALPRICTSWCCRSVVFLAVSPKEHKEYAKSEKQVKTEIGVRVLEVHGLAKVVDKSYPPSWGLTKKVYDDLRAVGSALQVADMEGAALALPISTPRPFDSYAPEYQKYAEHFAIDIGINYLAFMGIKAATVVMSVSCRTSSEMSQRGPSNFYH